MAEKHTIGTKHDEPMAPRLGEPVAPGVRDIDREMDPTKRRRDVPEGKGAPDMGGDKPHREHDKDKPTGTTPTR